MTVTLHKWDLINELKTQEECDAYLQVVFEDGDAQEIARALGDVAKAQKRWGLIAQETGKNRSGLYRAFDKGGNPTMDTLFKVIHALGYTLVPQRINSENMPAQYC
ncbi:putative addiction module antidote protein [bacterium]|nr:putative addiction module antidote protein [bacterium]